MIIQVILGVLLGAGVAIRVFWKQIKNFFTGKKDADFDPTEIDPAEVIDITEDQKDK